MAAERARPLKEGINGANVPVGIAGSHRSMTALGAAVHPLQIEKSCSEATARSQGMELLHVNLGYR